MRPEPRGVQGSPALHVVQGGMKKTVLVKGIKNGYGWNEQRETSNQESAIRNNWAGLEDRSRAQPSPGPERIRREA